MKNYHVFLLYFVIFPIVSFSQSTIEWGILPSYNVNKKLPKDWSLNFKAESRQSVFNGDFNFDYLLTDISLIASKKLGINTTLAMGYLMRIDDEERYNRMIQQISFVRRYSSFRLSHRVSSDQTFNRIDYPEFRLRYRVSSEIPLQGHSLDPNEFFLKLNHEYLGSLERDDFDLEVRVASFIGYTISPINKIEIGIDYRIASFINGSSKNRLWIGFTIFQSI